MPHDQFTLWVIFNLLILIFIVCDRLFGHRGTSSMDVREALIWTGIWISLALTFNLGIWYFDDSASAATFLTAYLVEKSLSVDNLFVFLLIFTHFKIPPHLQHRILNLGIIGALLMRGVFIFLGVHLIAQFSFLIYILGAFLIFSGLKFFFSKSEEEKDHKLFRIFGKFRQPSPNDDLGYFIMRKDHGIVLTRLFFVLIIIEITDLIFALDSIPAILAISNEPFVIYTSNAFAILGLRSLYFALAGLVAVFKYLNLGVAAILVLVGGKMMVKDYWHPPEWGMLLIIAFILGISALAFGDSVKKRRSEKSGISAVAETVFGPQTTRLHKCSNPLFRFKTLCFPGWRFGRQRFRERRLIDLPLIKSKPQKNKWRK